MTEVDGFPSLIGSSPAMQRVRTAIAPAASSDSPVFLTGESGTGKDLMARTIHDASNRADGNFVPLNGSGLPDDILDRELFGPPGPQTPLPYPTIPRYLAEAQDGTLYIDDVCRMSQNLQARLLHLLHTGLIVDAEGTARPFAARLIAATNTPLTEALRTERLRRDLYDRLAVIQIDIPPLRARRGDAAEIAVEIFPELLDRFGLPPTRLSPVVLARINALPWPGNVRQLTNVLRRMALAPSMPGGHGPELPADVLADIDPDSDQPAQHEAGGSFSEIERRAILDAISRHGGSVQKAADELQLAASTIYRKLKGWQDG